VKSKEILESWKDIARYLEKDIKTCRRWEKELGLPIHRIDNTASRTNVFAYKEEINQWLRDKAKSRDEVTSGKSAIYRYSLVALTAVIIGIMIYLAFFQNTKPRSGRDTESNAKLTAFDEVKSQSTLPVNTKSESNQALNELFSRTDNHLELYSQGKYFIEKNTRETNEFAIALFLRAFTINNKFSLALLGIAQCYINYVVNEWDIEIEWLDKASELIKEPDQELADYPEYYSLITQIDLLKYIHFEHKTLETAFANAEESLNKHPNHPHLNHLMGKIYYFRFGRSGIESDFEKAADFMKNSYWLNPYAAYNIEYAELLLLKKEFQAASDVCNQIKLFDYTWRSNFHLAEIHYYSGDLEVSKILLEKLYIPIELRFVVLHYLGMIAARKNDTSKLRSIHREIELLTVPEKKFEISSLMQASIHFGMGEKEEGYKDLRDFFNTESGKKKRFVYLIYIDLDDNFAKYRDEEQFKAITVSSGNEND
jgi:hypothetical protein